MDPINSEIALGYLTDHIVLPPKLPQGRERHYIQGDRKLLETSAKVLAGFDQYSPPKFHQAIAAIHRMVVTWLGVTEGTSLDTEKLNKALEDLRTDGKIRARSQVL